MVFSKNSTGFFLRRPFSILFAVKCLFSGLVKAKGYLRTAIAQRCLRISQIFQGELSCEIRNIIKLYKHFQDESFFFIFKYRGTSLKGKKKAEVDRSIPFQVSVSACTSSMSDRQTA